MTTKYLMLRKSLVLISVIFIAVSAYADDEDRAASDSGVFDAATTQSADAEEIDVSNVAGDELIKRLIAVKSKMAPSLRNAKACPGGKFELNGDSLTVYSRRDSDGINYGAAENFTLSASDEGEPVRIVSRSKDEAGIWVTKTCESYMSRFVDHSGDAIEVTAKTREVCNGVEQVHEKKIRVSKSQTGKMLVRVSLSSTDKNRTSYSCAYGEGGFPRIDRPRPTRPALPDKSKVPVVNKA